MIRKIRLEGYKSFADATLDAAPLTVVFGPNDAGKSNLLDGFDLLSELVEVDSLKKAFDTALHRGRLVEAFFSPRGFGEEGLRELKRRGTLELTLTVDFDLQDQVQNRINAQLADREQIAQTKVAYTRVVETYLRYRISLRYDYASGEPFVADENLVSLSGSGEPRASRRPFIELDKDHQRFVARIERQGHPRYFDIHRNRTLLSEISDPVYHPHVVAAKEELRSWRSYYVEPSLVRRESGVHGAEDPGRHGEDLAAFYWKLKHEHPDHFKVVSMNLARLIPSLRGIDIREVRGTLDPVVLEASGGEFPFRLASEGTLRLLCLLGIAVAPNAPSMVAYEEPENGVQPGRIDILAGILEDIAARGRTQVILTSHSPPFIERLRGAHLVRCFRNETGRSSFEDWAAADRMFVSQGVEEGGGEPVSERQPSRLSERLLRGEL